MNSNEKRRAVKQQWDVKVAMQKAILKELEIAWLRVPDWRFGQLVSNLLGAGPHDVFFPSDERWLEMLTHFNDPLVDKTSYGVVE